MPDSKSGSKNDLNESNMPLLDDEQAEKAGEKEQIELSEKDDSNEKEKKDKKKAKKEKKPKEKKPKGPSCIDTMSAGLDINHRDDKSINTEIDLGFNDVLAEPNTTQGFDAIWRVSFILFGQTKLWIYRILAAVVAPPLAIIWGLVFALLTVLYVWILSPFIKLFEFVFFLIRRVWTGLLGATLEPVCKSFGAVFSNVNVAQKRHFLQDA